MTLNYTLTAYPKLYDYTYWGHNNCSLPNEIITNRNNFVVEHDIVSVQSYKKIQHQKIFTYIEDTKTGRHRFTHLDHVEWYYTKQHEFIVISSPYHPNEEEKKRYEADGWIEIPVMYGRGTGDVTTYMLRFTKDSLKQDMKSKK